MWFGIKVPKFRENLLTHLTLPLPGMQPRSLSPARTLVNTMSEQTRP